MSVGSRTSRTVSVTPDGAAASAARSSAILAGAGSHMTASSWPAVRQFLQRLEPFLAEIGKIEENPVMLPPGRVLLAMKPLATGSLSRSTPRSECCGRSPTPP